MFIAVSLLALGVSEGNLLNQSMSRGVKDGQDRRSRKQKLYRLRSRCAPHEDDQLRLLVLVQITFLVEGSTTDTVLLRV